MLDIKTVVIVLPHTVQTGQKASKSVFAGHAGIIKEVDTTVDYVFVDIDGTDCWFPTNHVRPAADNDNIPCCHRCTVVR
jgi:hypothetical protein